MGILDASNDEVCATNDTRHTSLELKGEFQQPHVLFT